MCGVWLKYTECVQHSSLLKEDTVLALLQLDLTDSSLHGVNALM